MTLYGTFLSDLDWCTLLLYATLFGRIFKGKRTLLKELLISDIAGKDAPEDKKEKASCT